MVIQVERNLFESEADVILHQVNCQGVMGSGVAKQVRERYPWVFATYKDLCEGVPLSERAEWLLGRCQLVFIDEKRRVGNLFAQDQYGYDGKCYTNYEALRQALEIADQRCKNLTIAVPYLMGCHRGGGDWSIVEKMIHEVFDDSVNFLMICKYEGG